jgi:uncharacterized protein
MDEARAAIERQTLGTVSIDGSDHPLDVNPAADRFEILVDGHAAFLTYRLKGSVLSLMHTEVPVRLRGRGLAEVLARTALEYAGEHGMSVRPYCPFVSSYIRRHSEFMRVVDPDFPPV